MLCSSSFNLNCNSSTSKTLQTLTQQSNKVALCNELLIKEIDTNKENTLIKATSNLNSIWNRRLSHRDEQIHSNFQLNFQKLLIERSATYELKVTSFITIIEFPSHSILAVNRFVIADKVFLNGFP